MIEMLMQLMGPARHAMPASPAPEPQRQPQSGGRTSGPAAPQLSADVRAAMDRFGLAESSLGGLIPHWNETQSGPGDSRNFQRELYELWTGQQAPENYTGFHASQVDRLENVFSPDEVDLDMMREIAVLATALREYEEAGHTQRYDEHKPTAKARGYW